jgi:LPXTG-motif cell wall-anchored protein
VLPLFMEIEEDRSMNRRISIGVVVALLLSVALFSIASAHAKLVSSDPAAGTKLTAAPTKVTLVFSEEISAKADETYFTVKDEQGNQVGKGQLDNTDLDHKTQSATLNTALGDGIYTVTWFAVTPDDDGHSNGSFSFGVNKDPGVQPTAKPEPTDVPEPTATPAAGAAAKPTAAPVAAGAAPATLPKTGESAPNLTGYFILGALLLVSGLALLRGRKRA